MKPDDLAARGVRVKALEWEDRGGLYTAQTTWGRYAVGTRGELCIWAWNGDDRPAETFEAAKAAAQADYEARILAAQELAPAALAASPEVAKLIREERSAADALYVAVRDLLRWDQQRGYLVPYRVRDPVHKAMRAIEAAALCGKETT